MTKRYTIVAASQNNVIGNNGKIPWNLPEDLSRFKRLTRGHTVVMGRKTYESIGRPLPARTNVVITSDPDYKSKVPESVVIMRSIEETKNLTGTVFYIGGEAVYREALKFSDVVFLTRIHKTIDGDAFFPSEGLENYQVVAERDMTENGINYSFINMARL